MSQAILMLFDWECPPVQAAKHVLQLAQRLEASLTLLVIRPQLDELMEQDHQHFEQSTLVHLQAPWHELEAIASSLGVALTLEIAASGHAANTVLEFSRERAFDWLVVCKPHIHHWLQEMVSGEAWRQVIDQATFPILVLPDQ
ncbi:universal stress protein [Chromobacterium piscinae]|uniref:Universal stress protein n=1 Tax=Chromobacterium piscinae TaxID=686831 RepID=A0ABV0H850_9NEIS